MAQVSDPDNLAACVIGGGVAGLACAGILQERGRVVVLDKGRGPGGRASTRRGESGRFDHGAQYFTARGPDFSALVDRLADEGRVGVWDARLGVIRKGSWSPSTDEQRWVGVPGMNELARAMGEGLDVRHGVRAVGVRRDGEAWFVRGDQESECGPFRTLVVAVPGPQAGEMVRPAAPGLARETERARISPCWAVMAAFDGPVDAPFDGARIEDEGTLGWIARDSSKPGRVRDGVDRWVLHATPGWSQHELEREPAWVVEALLGAFRDLVGVTPGLLNARAHRWRYALAAEPLGTAFLYDGSSRLGFCGDWLLGARVEAAYDSGTALGRAILGGSR
ncbi:MAG: NAD(P)-binding protein [Phycisphaerales bacterium]|nr:FAD-dependent oxidoreductase [Planctomycetota bacterium]MCH8507720.1 NAD(P)-binding protein [Phycisphaerales bacterium]